MNVYVAIPSSSGQSFKHVSGLVERKIKTKVAIPSSSGQSFKRSARVPHLTSGELGRNPFFIRSILQTPKRDSLPDVVGSVAIPSSSGQSFKQSKPPACGSSTRVAIPSSSGQSFKLRSSGLSTSSPKRSQSLLHQVNPSNLEKAKAIAREAVRRNPFFIRSILQTSFFRFVIAPIAGACRNPFFIRSILQTSGHGARWLRGLMVAIPSSSGQSFKRSVAQARADSEPLQSQSLLHQVNPSNSMARGCSMAHQPHRRNPFFIRSILQTRWLRGLMGGDESRRNPFFIRSILQTASLGLVARPRAISRNPFFIRSILQTTAPPSGQSPRARRRNPFFIRSILQTEPQIPELPGPESRNPFFIRSILQTGWGGRPAQELRSRNPFFIRSILQTIAFWITRR